MVKFSHGCWHPAPDTIIDWAVETVKAQAREESLHFVTVSHRTGGPAIKTGKTDENLTFCVGDLTATVNTQPKAFDLSFRHKKQLLTRLGWRSVGYIKEGTTALHPKANYTDPNKGQRWVTYQLQLGVGDKVYGLGERFGPFAKNGQSIDMWNDDGGTGSELTYKNIPFFITSAGYGVFIPTSGFMSLEVQTERTTRVNIAVPGESLSVYFIYGSTPKDILATYSHITGAPALPPPWTFGLWLTTSFTTKYDENTVSSFLDGMKERDIAVSVFHFDCFWMPGFEWCDYEFDKDYFPDAAGQLSRLKEKGIHICVWINPYIAQESSIFDEGADKGYFIKRGDGSVWQYDFWQAGMGFIDFTNPDACKWYQDKLQKLVDMGVDSFKTDFGERIPTGDAVYFDGSDPYKMHNYYPYLYNKVTFEVLEKNYGKNKAAVFARSATAGCQQFPVHWGGDPSSTFEAMAETLRGGLSLALSGFGYWAHDIGGFDGKPEPALFKRWIAFGLFSSHSRLHGAASFRVPWLIDETEEASKVLKHFVGLKHQLMPYLYAQAISTHLTGVPMLRAMFLEYPSDPAIWQLDQQYMLGDSLLVAPIFSDDNKVTYYLPKGEWYGILDQKIRHGPGYLTEEFDFFGLPVLLKPGGAIVMGKGGEKVVYDWTHGFKLLVNVEESMVVTLNVPSHEEAGDNVFALEITASGSELSVAVVNGQCNSAWELVVANKRVRSADGGEISSQGVVSVAPGAAKVVTKL
ncbi:glycosyl hydrolases family 31-domain-containing protein [Massariosphaeria phaeospora]|uniref:alpha-D-xyloside xylohydrolase n=1 Tax=Massariosphaeria phaeospora TaxID=100035 RepID=A0A7C8I1R8_9PLEO|nr:glycosyl hydrolases family 31-domain-containing protein [Massariosphaeria phaeospora]